MPDPGATAVRAHPDRAPESYRGTAVLLVGLALIGGCATDSAGLPDIHRTDCRAASFAAPFDHLDTCDGEAVLTAAVTAIFTYRPEEQTSPADALHAALPLLVEDFAAGAETGAMVWGPATTADWQRWRRDGVPVGVAAFVRADDHPPDSATRIARVISVDLQTPEPDPPVFAVFATATRERAGSGWRLSGLLVAP